MTTDAEQIQTGAEAPLARVLPFAAAVLLHQAAETVITADPLTRVKAIERAIARVKREWPTYFRE